MTIWIPLIAAIVGALVYGLAQPKPAELGRLLFAVGALVTVWNLAHAAVRIVGD